MINGNLEKDIVSIKPKEIIMPTRNKTKRTYKRKNIDGNFRGSEDIFFRKVRDGLKEFLRSPFK